MLTTVEPGNLTENFTSTLGKKGDNYDARGAMYFTVATVCVYGLGIIFFIGSHISKREENKDEEHQIENYLKSAPKFQYQKERDEVLRLRAQWLANSLVGMPGSSNFERRLSRAQRPIRHARVLSEESSGADSQTPLVSPDVSSPDSNSIFPWPHLGRRMRRNACSISFSPIPDEEMEPAPDDFQMSGSSLARCESHNSGLNMTEGTEDMCDDVDHGVCSLDTAASSREDRGEDQNDEVHQVPFSPIGANCWESDFIDESPYVQVDQRRQETSDLLDSDERDEYDDSTNDSDDCHRVKDVATRGSHSVSGVCGVPQQHERPTLPAILITSSSSPELHPIYANPNFHPSFRGAAVCEDDTAMPCRPSNAADGTGSCHGVNNSNNREGTGSAIGDRRRRQGVYQVAPPWHMESQHSHLFQLPIDSNRNPNGDYNGNFQAADEGSSEPNSEPNGDHRSLLPPCDVDRASRWSLPGRVTSQAHHDVTKVRDLGRRFVRTLQRLPDRLRGQSHSNPFLASPTSTSPTVVRVQASFEETRV